MPPASNQGTMPQDNEGEKAAAKGQVQMAIKILTKALSALGLNSEEGNAVYDSLKSLKKFGLMGGEGSNLVSSEMMNHYGNMPAQGAGASQMPPPGGGMQPSPGGMPPGAS